MKPNEVPETCGLPSMVPVPHRSYLKPDQRPTLMEKPSDLNTGGFPLALTLGGSRLDALDLNRYSRDRRFVCNYCGKCFTSSRSLETHVRVHTGERPYSCAQCGKRFTQSGHLKTHQSVHTGERPFACEHCGKRFTYATSQNLEVHMRIHTGERPFSCEQCGKKFTQSAHLKSHLSVHTGESRGAAKRTRCCGESCGSWSCGPPARPP
uniref:C2H2-type domain-containing protein n=1 Tax=Amphilophus citrinellus TaxID=61819 RepID=A0A3Q0RIQ8_AMPCI